MGHLSQSDVDQLRCKHCNKSFKENAWVYSDPRYIFCTSCRKAHGRKVLIAQLIYKKPIKDLLKELLRQHRDSAVMADFLDISRPTLYQWIRKFFKDDEGVGLQFQDFKRKYLCRGKACIPLSKDDITPETRKKLISELRKRKICICGLKGQGVLMANAEMFEVVDILGRLNYPVLK